MGAKKIGTSNKLEKVMLAAIGSAPNEYGKMTKGAWLWHGPESFLQMHLAREIYKKTDHAVYVDASIKKIQGDEGAKRVGRPASNIKERPDITVWNKSSHSLRAIVEIKRSWSIGPVRTDAKRVRSSLKRVRGPKAGYLVVYTDANNVGKLEERFENWEAKLNCRLLGCTIDNRVSQGDVANEYWAIGLLRIR